MIWAAVDVMGGKCVQLIQGNPETARFSQDPAAAAKRSVSESADGIHFVDLDAALGKGSNKSLLQQIVRALNIPTQVGGGIREERSIESWLEAGAERVIVGTRGIEDPGWLREMTAQFPRRIVLAIDSKGDEITTSGWTTNSGLSTVEFANSLDNIGLAAFLYTNVDVEGSLEGINVDRTATLCSELSTPMLISGGIKDADDVKNAYQCGAAGVVIGTAIYTGDIRIQELKQEIRNG